MKDINLIVYKLYVFSKRHKDWRYINFLDSEHKKELKKGKISNDWMERYPTEMEYYVPTNWVVVKLRTKSEIVLFANDEEL